MSIWNSVAYMYMEIFQVLASSSRLSVFFTAFPNQEFDVSSLTCRPRPPGNPLGEMERKLSVQWKFLPGHSLGNVHLPSCRLVLAKRGCKSRELHAVKTDFGWSSRNRAHCLSVLMFFPHILLSFSWGDITLRGVLLPAHFPVTFLLSLIGLSYYFEVFFLPRWLVPRAYLHISPCSETSRGLHR